MTTATVPATCSAYTVPTKYDLTKNKLTIDTTTTATLGWIQANDCKTDADTSMQALKTAMIANGSWQTAVNAGMIKTTWFDGSYTDGLAQYLTLTFIPDASTGAIMGCISQSGGYSCAWG
jgi:hypothetical protein